MTDRPAIRTTAELRASGHVQKHLREELRGNLLAALAEFPDAVCAQVLSHLLANRYMGLAHVDVLFASIVEAATLEGHFQGRERQLRG